MRRPNLVWHRAPQLPQCQRCPVQSSGDVLTDLGMTSEQAQPQREVMLWEQLQSPAQLRMWRAEQAIEQVNNMVIGDRQVLVGPLVKSEYRERRDVNNITDLCFKFPPSELMARSFLEMNVDRYIDNRALFNTLGIFGSRKRLA